MYHHPNFKYCTLYVSGTELQTKKQIDGWTDDPISRCPRRNFQASGIKISQNNFQNNTSVYMYVSNKFLARLHFSAEEQLLYPWRQRPRLCPHAEC